MTHSRLSYLEHRIELLEKDLADYDALHAEEDAPYNRTRRYIVEELESHQDELSALEDAWEEQASNAGRW